MRNKSNDVVKFIADFIGVKANKISSESRIYEDLKVDGDDAIELIFEFAKHFEVDMEGFEPKKYFAPEGIDLIGALLGLFKKNKKLEPLKVSHLVDAANKKRWND